MNLSTPFSVNIISQMRAKQWRRPEEELESSLVGIKGSHTHRHCSRNVIDGEYTGLCDYDVCRMMLMETNGITSGYVKY